MTSESAQHSLYSHDTTNTPSGEEIEGSVRIVAGQRNTVAYPSASHHGGDERQRVSVAGLKNRRAFRQFSQSELARRSGVNQGTISQIESAGTATHRTACLLASALGVTVEDLSEIQQRSRFPERASTERASPNPVSREHHNSGEQDLALATEETAVRGTAPAGDNEAANHGPIRIEVPEPVLQRVDRLLDILEAVMRVRRT